MTDYAYGYCTTRIFKINSCELCKTKYPDAVNMNGHKYEIFNVQRPKDRPYLLLEVLGMLEGKNIKIIGIQPDTITVLGRDE